MIQNNPFRVRRVERMKDEEIFRGYCPFPELSLADRRTTIIQGSRGSGKSTLLRLLCASPQKGYLQTTPEGDPIAGTYVNFSFHSLANYQANDSYSEVGLSENQRTIILMQDLNLFIARRLAVTLNEVLKLVFAKEDERVRFGAKTAQLLLDQFTYNSQVTSLREVDRIFSNFQKELSHKYVLSLFNDGDFQEPENLIFSAFFEPIEKAILDIQKILNVDPAYVWLFAFDELDHLTKKNQCQFNFLCRSVSYPIVIKAACLPHGHKTLETHIPGIQADIGQDFDYKALTFNSHSKKLEKFCKDLYTKRLEIVQESHIPKNPLSWLGKEALRERTFELMLLYFKKNSQEVKSWEEAIHIILNQNLNVESLDYRPENKYIPSLAMKIIYSYRLGNKKLRAYCGWSDVIAASDGNPRRLFRLLDRLYEKYNSTPHKLKEREWQIEQSEVILDAAESSFKHLVSIPFSGKKIQDIVDHIGNSLSERLHQSSSTVLEDSSSIYFDLSTCSADLKEVFEAAIDYGVLLPWNFGVTDGYPKGNHKYWLSFGLAPKYYLLLRKGIALSFDNLKESDSKQLWLFGGDT